MLVAKIQLHGQRPSHAMRDSGSSYVFLGQDDLSVAPFLWVANKYNLGYVANA